ncbi:MAG: hypothetical protein LBE91_21440 [Tannerella sp.]|nr:hypothetical protein [Tannerella sp.]
MMTKKISPRRALSKKMALVPLFAAAVFIFSAKTAAQNDASTATALSETKSENTDDLIIIGKGLSEEKMAEYQQIVDKKADWKSLKLKNDDFNNLYLLYVQMNKEQQKKQRITFDGVFCVDTLMLPDDKSWKKCKTSQYIWLNGEKSDQQALELLNRQDVYYYSLINLDINNRVSATWTKKGYEEYLKKFDGKVSEEELLKIKPTIYWHYTSEGLYLVATPAVYNDETMAKAKEKNSPKK